MNVKTHKAINIAYRDVNTICIQPDGSKLFKRVYWHQRR